jgi:hypothetical protein
MHGAVLYRKFTKKYPLDMKYFDFWAPFTLQALEISSDFGHI